MVEARGWVRSGGVCDVECGLKLGPRTLRTVVNVEKVEVNVVNTLGPDGLPEFSMESTSMKMNLSHITNISNQDPDPNQLINRVPTKTELIGLNTVKETHQRLAKQLLDEVARAQEANRPISARYQQQLLELEGTQSQLRESNKSIQLLQDQYALHQAEVDRLSGITHPIRRCPSDVLRCIFETTCFMARKKTRIRLAIALSHVCQRWRSVALDTPRLWCQIDFTLHDVVKDAIFWEYVIPRMKAVPASIVIRHLDQYGHHILNRCMLSLIPTIRDLSLHFISPVNIGYILNPGLFPVGGMESLSIFAHEPQYNDAAWDLGDIVERIPVVSKLTLRAPYFLDVNPSVKLATLTRLTLREFQDVDVLALFALCTSLTDLRLSEVTLQEAAPTTQASSPSLQTLYIYAMDEIFLTAPPCPNLTAFHHSSESFNAAISFIESHPSILTLDYASDDDLLQTFSKSAPQVQSLTIEPSQLRTLCNWQAAGMENPPFPSLKVLTISINTTRLTQEAFDSIVKTRCLPVSHTHSQLMSSFTPLIRLSLLRNLGSDESAESEPWRNSELYEQAMQTLTMDALWNRWEIVNLSWT